MEDEVAEQSRLLPYQFAFENALDPTIVFDASGHALLLNREARELSDELVDRLFVNGGPAAAELSLFRAALATRGHAHVEVRVDGRSVVIDGKACGSRHVVTLRDVTDRRRLETELRDLQRVESIGQFTATLVHDFNNLLTPIACLSSCLEGDASVGGEAREMVGDIREAAERASALARQALRLVRREPTRVEVTDVNAVLTDLRSLVGRLVGSEVEVDLVLAKDAGAAMLDRERLEHVLLNLAANARDAMPAGGRLRLGTASVSVDEGEARAIEGAVAGSYVAVRVTDTGVGMTREVRERIFERFFTTKEPGRGTGLGLVSAKRFVAETGGCIGVHSEAGRGTTVSLYFPRLEARSMSSQRPTVAQGLRGSETLLVVDDERRVRGAMRSVLECNGYRVLDAASGEEAVAVARAYSGTIDLVIADVVMPGMGGLELGRRLASRPTRTLFTSGHTERRLERLGWQPECGPLLLKAFTPDELLRRVREVLAETPARAGDAATSISG
jgi:two-component system cell cycle sensor histidine kinase/response regulator CckA